MCHGRRNPLSFWGAVLLSAVGWAGAPEAPGHWVGTWATAPQPAVTGTKESYANQTVRLVAHTSIGGPRVRVRLSNAYGSGPVTFDAVHVALRTAEASVDPSSDRPVTFGGATAVTVPAKGNVVSDPVELTVPALADVAVSLFFKKPTVPSTSHLLTLQTNYVSEPGSGDRTAEATWANAKPVTTWPFLTGLDVTTGPEGAAVVAFGDSSVDGDGTTPDTNQRWTDALAAKLQSLGPDGRPDVAVLNEGLIGNRLLKDSPKGPANPAGPAFGASGLSRFERDALEQPGVKLVIVRLGLNDLGFPGSFAPAGERATAAALIAGFRSLIAQARKKNVRLVGSTLTPFEGADLEPGYWSAAKEAVRQQVNDWLRTTNEFAAVVDFDAVVRDPSHPARLLPSYDSGDHIHPNDAGHLAMANAVSLEVIDEATKPKMPVK